MKFIKGGVCAANGFLASGVHCGLRKNAEQPDLALIYSDTPCTAAGVFTKNVVKAAPVLLDIEKIKSLLGVSRMATMSPLRITGAIESPLTVTIRSRASSCGRLI